jgi:hypothetical protein
VGGDDSGEVSGRVASLGWVLTPRDGITLEAAAFVESYRPSQIISNCKYPRRWSRPTGPARSPRTRCWRAKDVTEAEAPF